jgi:arginine/lysine/ornithine decarboxylase
MDAPPDPFRSVFSCHGLKKHHGEEDSLGVAGCHLAERLHDERLIHPPTPHIQSLRFIRFIEVYPSLRASNQPQPTALNQLAGLDTIVRWNI